MWSPGRKMKSIEKDVLRQALRFYQGNQSRTASSLGISVKSVYNKVKEYGLEKEVRDEGTAPSKLPKGQTLQTSQGHGVEPAVGSSEKQPLPVSQREKV